MQHRNSASLLLHAHTTHSAQCTRSLVVDHIALVTQPALEHLCEWCTHIRVFLGNLGCIAHQHTECIWVADHHTLAGLTQLLHHFSHSDAVALTCQVQETERMVLHHIAHARHIDLFHGAILAVTPKTESEPWTQAAETTKGWATLCNTGPHINSLLHFVAPALHGIARFEV